MFLSLGQRTLFRDADGGSKPFVFPGDIDVKDKVLDFTFEDLTRTLRVFTTEGDAIWLQLDTDETATVASFATSYIAGSIYRTQILAITGEFKPVLLNFKGELVQEFLDIKKKVRYCLLNGALSVLADSSSLFVKRAGAVDWEMRKSREFYIRELMDVNRHVEFGVLTRQNTRIVRTRFHEVFRTWAKDTLCLQQCPGAKHVYAHLACDGVLRIGDSGADYSIEESARTGICWDLGILWSRSETGSWHRLVLSFRDAVFDLRATRLEALETHRNVEDDGVLGVLEGLIARPALAKEVLPVLPGIAQNLTTGVYVADAKRSLDAYITRGESIRELIGQIDLTLSLSAKNT